VDYLKPGAHTLRVYAAEGVIGVDAFVVDTAIASAAMTDSAGFIEVDDSLEAGDEQLAFICEWSIGGSALRWICIKAVGDETTTPEIGTSNPLSSPEWSKDGSRLAFVKDDDKLMIRRFNGIDWESDVYAAHEPDPGHFDWTEIDDRIDWSPFENLLAYSIEDGAGVYAIDIDQCAAEGDKCPLTPRHPVVTGDADTRYYYPTWSSDGSQLAYVEKQQQGSDWLWRIWTVSIDYDPVAGTLQVGAPGLASFHYDNYGTIITNPPPNYEIKHLDWEPQLGGQRIVFEIENPSGQSSIHAIDLSEYVAPNPVGMYPPTPQYALDYEYPAWSRARSNYITYTDGNNMYQAPIANLQGGRVSAGTGLQPRGGPRATQSIQSMCIVTAVSTPGTISQMAQDMQAIAFNQGLYTHGAPSINAARVVADNLTFDITSHPIFGYSSYLPWGSSVAVKYRYLDTAGQLWYGFSSSYSISYGGVTGGYNSPTPGEAPEEAIVWVAARAVLTSTNGTVQYVPYFENVEANPIAVTEDSTEGNEKSIEDNDDPCNGHPEVITPQSLTFPYHRQLASTYADLHSRDNNGRLNHAVGEINRRILSTPTNIPYGYFQYSSVDHLNETGSATFVSESLYIGGMPWTLRYDSRGSAGCPFISATQYAGWYYCHTMGTNGNPSFMYRNHAALPGYYTDKMPPSPSPDDHLNRIYDIISPKGVVVTQFKPPDDHPEGVAMHTFNEDQIEHYVDLDAGVPKSNLAAFSMLLKLHREIEAGDYMWVDPNSGTEHGFVVVGWGQIGSCASIINATQTPLSVGYQPDTVPYIADFSHGYSSPSSTQLSQTQAEVPRPFYCSRFRSPTYFDALEWYFFHLEDRATVKDGDNDSLIDLYMPESWKW
jgi:hypothetical protein